jgi:hypothetical protein
VARSPKFDGETGDLISPFSTETQELDTSELANMETSGEVKAKPNLMIQVDEGGALVELQPGWSHTAEGGGLVDDAKVIVADAPAPPMPRPRPIDTPRPNTHFTTPAPPARSGIPLWLLIAVYLIAGGALALAIRERFF